MKILQPFLIHICAKEVQCRLYTEIIFYSQPNNFFCRLFGRA